MDLKTKVGRRFIEPNSKKIHTVGVKPGLQLGYRKGVTGGRWYAKLYKEGFKYTYHFLGEADDLGRADGTLTLTYQQASEKAIELQLRKAREKAGEIHDGPYTVRECMDDYLKDRARELKVKVDDPKLYRTQSVINAHILPKLGDLQVKKLTHTGLKKWRDEIADAPPRVRKKAKAKVQTYRTINADDPDTMRKRQATVNRVLTVLKAALNFAKSHSERVESDAAWVDIKPFRRVDVPKIRFLTQDEVSALVPACTPDFANLVKGVSCSRVPGTVS